MAFFRDPPEWMNPLRGILCRLLFRIPLVRRRKTVLPLHLMVSYLWERQQLTGRKPRALKTGLSQLSPSQSDGKARIKMHACNTRRDEEMDDCYCKVLVIYEELPPLHSPRVGCKGNVRRYIGVSKWTRALLKGRRNLARIRRWKTGRG